MGYLIKFRAQDRPCTVLRFTNFSFESELWIKPFPFNVGTSWREGGGWSLGESWRKNSERPRKLAGRRLRGLPYRGAVSPRMLATMDRQSSLRLVICNSSTGFVPPPTAFAWLSRDSFLGNPLPFLPSKLPVIQLLSVWWRCTTWPRNFKCPRRITLVIPLLAPARSKTCPLLTLSVQDIFSSIL